MFHFPCLLLALSIRYWLLDASLPHLIVQKPRSPTIKIDMMEGSTTTTTGQPAAEDREVQRMRRLMAEGGGLDDRVVASFTRQRGRWLPENQKTASRRYVAARERQRAAGKTRRRHLPRTGSVWESTITGGPKIMVFLCLSQYFWTFPPSYYYPHPLLHPQLQLGVPKLHQYYL